MGLQQVQNGNTSMNLKTILVIGATGAQGMAVVDKLLAPCEDGRPSPYAVRAFTRDTGSKRAKELAQRGVQCVEGSFDNLPSVECALRDVYGMWVNTDGFTVGEEKETWAGIRIFELARKAKCVKHYVWSNLDYAYRAGNYDEQYRCQHYDGKARVADWMRSQPSGTTPDDMAWSIVTSGPYMDMLFNLMFGPLKTRADGTAVFATPIGCGHVPMIALADLAFFARHTFDHRESTSGRELQVASDVVGWDALAATFTRVTGRRAEVVHQTVDEWFANFEGVDDPLANERGSDGANGVELGDMAATTTTTTWAENFRGWWALWRDDVITRDMGWVRRVHPRALTLEAWMRANAYDGGLRRALLKNSEDGKTIRPKWDVIEKL
ncbi:NAD(P)-binding protein [Epithele typhae]|uniref:NAD(P)-binding protein n=1 Tax=Epithele typhae TaxID=378194 RepID=UPI0020087BCA|nr:NAD(P)-binding protein [Epithele typhae]KAH9945037.1 NAD(P)-binding protein [Epithele typhae]